MSASNKGFWNLLFEFSFSRFISLKIIGVLYAIGMLFGGLAAVGIIIAGFSNGSTGVFSLILVPFSLILLDHSAGRFGRICGSFEDSREYELLG